MASRKRDMDDAMSLAWHTASLNAFAHHQPKKMPKLETLVGGEKKKRNQTGDEQIAMLKSLWAKRSVVKSEVSE